jgi:hypothetical protein
MLDHRKNHTPQSLSEPVWSPHYLRQEIRGLDDILNDRKTLGTVAIEQPFIAMVMKEKVKLPDQVPNIMEPSIHSLPTKRAMNVSSIPSDEDSPDSQLCRLAVMDAKIAAPVQGVGFDCTWCALIEYLPYELQRRRVSFRVLNRSNNSPTSTAHWKDCERSEFTRT